MKNKVCNRKTKEAAKKDMENHTNQNDGNSNTACTYLKFVSFALTIDQGIQRSLQLQ